MDLVAGPREGSGISSGVFSLARRGLHGVARSGCYFGREAPRHAERTWTSPERSASAVADVRASLIASSAPTLALMGRRWRLSVLPLCALI